MRHLLRFDIIVTSAHRLKLRAAGFKQVVVGVDADIKS